MKNLFVSLIVLMVTFHISGCGRVRPDIITPPLEVNQLNGQDYGVLEGDITGDGSSLQGTGTIIFRSPLAEEDNNFDLSFSLNSGGSVTLIPNAGAGLASSVFIMFSRKEDGTLGVSLFDGASSYQLEDDFSNPISATNTISVEVDVHGHGHIILWTASERADFAFTSDISGKFWGLRLNDALVGKALAKDAKEPH